MYTSANKAKFTLAGIAVVAAGLALGSFTIRNWHQTEALRIGRVLEVTMSGLLLFGIFGAEVRHRGPILLTWLITTIVFCHTLIFIMSNAYPYPGEFIFVTITEILLVGMMYIVYRTYCWLDGEPELGWTHRTYQTNSGFQSPLKSVDIKEKKIKQSEMAQPPPYEEQNEQKVSVY